MPASSDSVVHSLYRSEAGSSSYTAARTLLSAAVTQR